MMKNMTIKIAVLGALGLASAQVLAGFESLPATGFSVAAGANYPGSPAGTSAYRLCNTSGDFGSGPTTPPASSLADCAVTPANEFVAPIAGFSLITAASRSIIVNNTYTGGTSKNVGLVSESVWRNAAQTECIYGAKVVMNSTAGADYLPASGAQYFEMNDLARGGFSGRPVDIAYYYGSATGEVIFRAGRTYTSVQHRSDVDEFEEQPLTANPPSPVVSINGIDATPLSTVPTPSQQSAAIDDNWVVFTTDANVNDDDGTSKAQSSMVYVKSTCSSAAPTSVPGAIRIRQTFQELNGDGVSDNRFIEAAVEGFVPPGATITPAHTDPY